MGVVLAETEYIREAILAAQPTEYITEVCRGELKGREFNWNGQYRDIGYVGGDLLNISTAIFKHRRLYTYKIPTARPIEFKDGFRPQSYIGRTIINLLETERSDKPDDGVVSFSRQRAMRTDHYCNKAEVYFDESLYQTCYYASPEILAIDNARKSHFYIKGKGADTLLTQCDTYVNGIKIPPGIICAVDYDKSLVVPTSNPKTQVLPLSGIQQITPLRVSTFAVPHDERRETFLRPENAPRQCTYDGEWNWLDQSLSNCDSMLNFNREIWQRLAQVKFELPF